MRRPPPDIADRRGLRRSPPDIADRRDLRSPPPDIVDCRGLRSSPPDIADRRRPPAIHVVAQVNRDHPLRIVGLDHVVLRCARLDETMAFYTEALGCTLERELPGLGLHQLRAGRALIDLVPIGSRLGGTEPPDAGRANMAHFCLRIDHPDWNALARHLAARGIEFAPPETRYGADGYGPSIYITDPEGNVVELKGGGERTD